ncbi:MAG: type II toxin-antitoxin system RelB/DinJ family antitoxin [Smithella sp.]
MAQTNINIRMDSDLKKQFDLLCSELGLTMTTAFNVFARTMVRQQRIPFDITLENPNSTTITAMKEAERLIADPNAKRYSSFTTLLEEVRNDL